MTLVAQTNHRSADRILELSVIDGKKPLSSSGLIDPRLFNGDQKLHAVMDPQTSLWSFKYSEGILPQPLKGTFTGFTALRKFAEDYFKKRNIEIKEIKD